MTASRAGSTSKRTSGPAEAQGGDTEEPTEGASASTAKRKTTAATDRPTKKRAYVPQHRSGAYGLLVGLHILTRSSTSSCTPNVSKTQLINAARPYSDTEYESGASSSRSSAAVPLSSHAATAGGSGGSRSFYTGWTSIKTLIAKGYVLQSGNPARYSLSDEGAMVSETLARDAGLGDSIVQPADVDRRQAEEVSDLDDDWSDDEQEAALQTRVSNFEPEIMTAGSYSIHLLVDNRERHRPGRRQEREPIATLLLERGVDVEMRALEVGDAVWIARRKEPKGGEEDEVVLDHIVERKRLDDLTSSILDGRWRDQKFRLSSSGVAKVLYLIEDHDVENQMRKFGPQIQTALSSSQVVDGFFVERTSGLTASIDYLAAMDGMIRRIYEHRDLSVMPSALISRSSFLSTRDELQSKSPSASMLTSFEAFQALNSKSGGLTSKEIFGKMLLCVKGMSAEKVREVLAVYSTMRELTDALAEAQDEPGGADAMLSSCTDGLDPRKKIGQALSRKLSELFLQPRYVPESGAA